jgi:hypothetical protein
MFITYCRDLQIDLSRFGGDSFENSNPPLAKDNLASFVESFMPVELCKNIGGRGECQK